MRTVARTVPAWRAVRTPLLGFPSIVLVRGATLARAVEMLEGIEPPFAATSIEREFTDDTWLIDDEAEQ